MDVINEQLWGQINVKTWQELVPHLWEDFRIALMETTTEQEARNVIVKFSNAFNEVVTEMQGQGVNIEFSPTILTTETEMIVNIVVSNRDYKTMMLGYLPNYERKSNVFNEILKAYDKEFRRLEQETEVVKRNMFLDTAIEKLSIYERDLGIESINKLDYRQRREQIVGRNRASFEQTTKETIKNVAAAYSNGDVKVDETEVAGIYEIKFIGSLGIPDNLDGLKKALDIIIPAHLGLSYTFTFNTWGMVSGLTWLDVSDGTWDDFRTWEGVV